MKMLRPSALAPLALLLAAPLTLPASGPCPEPLPESAYATRCTGGVVTLKEKGRTVAYRDCPAEERPRHPMAEELLRLIERVRCEVGDRVIVTSGYRSPRHNLYGWAYVAAREGPSNAVSRTSRHTKGRAVDFYVRGFTAEELRNLRAKLHRWAGRLAEPLRGSRERIWSRVYRRGEGRDPDNLHPHPYIHVEWRR
jgi:hypothetical protein